MDFELYGDDSEAIVRFDPRTKLLVFFVSCLLSLSVHGTVPILVIGFLQCAMLALNGKRALALKCFASLLVILFIRYCVEAPEQQGAEAITSLCLGFISLFIFFFPILVSFLLLVRTTRISQFLSAFQAMHLPMTIVIPLAVMFRFIPTVQNEWSGVRKAMVFRGISMTPGTIFRQPFQTIEYILVPLLFSSVGVMEELAAASLARGMDSKRERTSFEKVQLHLADVIAIIIFCTTAAWILYSRISGMSVL